MFGAFIAALEALRHPKSADFEIYGGADGYFLAGGGGLGDYHAGHAWFRWRRWGDRRRGLLVVLRWRLDGYFAYFHPGVLQGQGGTAQGLAGQVGHYEG